MYTQNLALFETTDTVKAELLQRALGRYVDKPISKLAFSRNSACDAFLESIREVCNEATELGNEVDGGPGFAHKSYVDIWNGLESFGFERGLPVSAIIRIAKIAIQTWSTHPRSYPE